MSENKQTASVQHVMPKNARIFVAGHNGMVGSALVRRLHAEGYTNLLRRSSAEMDLRDQASVGEFFASEQPDYVFLAAARVGGIVANSTRKGEFIYDNLMIQTNVIHNSYTSGVKRLLFLGSTCIYPKFSPQPIKEEYLLTGPLEPTNDAYAVAKIAGIAMCRSYNEQYGTRFLSAMPNNLYGPNDNFDLTGSHVLPALIRKFHEAKINGAETVTVWGTGSPQREFMHVDDLAAASLFLMNLPEDAYSALLGYQPSPAILPGWSKLSSATQVNLFLTPQSLTVPRENWPILPGCMPWDGNTASTSRRVCGMPATGLRKPKALVHASRTTPELRMSPTRDNRCRSAPVMCTRRTH
jgi:GDP-L-fucose synthase